MSTLVRLECLGRRDFILGATAIAALSTLLPGLANAQTPAADPIKALLGNATAAEGKINLELPEIAENGNTVPFTVSVDSAMTEQDFVKAVHIIAAGNPRPEIGSYFFTADAGKASTSSRMRLAKTQDIVAVAEMSDGKFYMSKRTVKVTIGGCGG